MCKLRAGFVMAKPRRKPGSGKGGSAGKSSSSAVAAAQDGYSGAAKGALAAAACGLLVAAVLTATSSSGQLQKHPEVQAATADGQQQQGVPMATRTTRQNKPKRGGAAKASSSRSSPRTRRSAAGAQRQQGVQEWAVQANGFLRGGALRDAYSALENAVAADDFDAAEPSTRFFVHFNLGRLLGFDLDKATDLGRAEQHFAACMQLNPDHVQVRTSLAELKTMQQDFAGAQTEIRAAMSLLMPNQEAMDTMRQNPDAQLTISVAHNLEVQTVQAMRQATDADGKAMARSAWDRAVKLGMQFDTPISKGVKLWANIADRHRSAARGKKSRRRGSGDTSGQCPRSNLSRWDLRPWRSQRPCQRLERKENVPLDQLMRSIDGTEPVVISGDYWPEFPDNETLASLLRQSAEEQAVVEVATAMDDGAVVQLQPLAPWAEAVSAVRKLAAEHEDTLFVRGAQEYVLLSDFLRLDPTQLRRGLYLFNSNLAVYLPRLNDAIRAPPTLQVGAQPPGRRQQPPQPRRPAGRLAEVNLWKGYGGTISGLHFDALDNLHHIYEGTKDFLLFPNSDAPKMTSRAGIIEVKVRQDKRFQPLRLILTVICRCHTVLATQSMSSVETQTLWTGSHQRGGRERPARRRPR